MSFTDAARTLVVSTSRWPVLRTVYQQAYDAGLSYAARRLASVPGVMAVMLRANDGSRAWTPGLSDYDLTVLTEPWDASQAVRFLDTLWSRYRSIKGQVPQLGEMEVMNVAEYSDFLAFGPQPTASLKRAQPLFVKAGSGIDQLAQRAPRQSHQREFLLDALSRHGMFVFPAWVDQGRSDNVLTRRRLAHMLENVGKRLSRVGVALETARAATVDDHMVLVFQGLIQACRAATLDAPAPKASFDRPGTSIAPDALATIRNYCHTVVTQSAIACCSAIAWISFPAPGELRLVFLVPDDVPEQELIRLLVALKRMPHPRVLAAVPTVASDSMWRCWCDVSPFTGLAVATAGQAAFGEPDCGQAQPSLASLQRGAEVQYASMIPLKNNWRAFEKQPAARNYAPLVAHALEYASVQSGVPPPAAPDAAFESLENAYAASVDALGRLRAALGAV